MPRRKDKKASGEYCGGFVDEHGQWNNGFYCPQWGGPGRKYCCGTDTHRFCCPQPPPATDNNSLSQQRLPLMVGLAMGSLVIAMLTFVGTCYFCRCCWLYRRRKRLHHDGHPHVTGGPVDYAVNYTVCPHSTYLRDGASSCYPMDDPPPYPGETSGVPEEKQPLNPTQLCVAIDGPDDNTSPVTYSLSRDASPPIRDYPLTSTLSEQTENNSRRQGPHHRPPTTSTPRCHFDHVTIFSNVGVGFGSRGSSQSSTVTPPTRCCPFNSRCRHLHRGGATNRLVKPPEDRRTGICYTNYNTLNSSQNGSSYSDDTRQVQPHIRANTEEIPSIKGPPIAGVVPTPISQITAPLPNASTSSGQYDTDHIDRYLNDCDGFTPLVRSNTFTLQGEGDIELTTFKLPSSNTDTEDDDAKSVSRRSIELGSFLRTPLAPPPMLPSGSFIQLPTGGGNESTKNSNSLANLCLPNGDVIFEPAVDILNLEEDEITDLTVQIKHQG